MCKLADIVNKKNGLRADIKTVYRTCLRRPRLSYDEFSYILTLNLSEDLDYFMIAKKTRNSVKTISEIKLFRKQVTKKKVTRRSKPYK